MLLFSANIAYSQADTVRVKDLLTRITQTSKPRNYQNVDQLNKTAAFLKTELEKYADTVFYQEYQVKGITYKNVIAAFHPEEKKTLVIGAHYDVCGNQQGADDNATGIVGVLELARLFDTLSFQHRLELVAFTLEEPPYFRTEYMGSAIHAKSLTERGLEPAGMMVLEMIGYFSDEKKSQDYPIGLLGLFYGRKGDYITVVNKLARGKFGKAMLKGMKRAKSKRNTIDVKSFQAPKGLTGIDFSDHLNYWALGIPACMITDTAFYRNKNYHESSDTIETIDVSRMTEVIDLVSVSVQRWDKR